MASQSNGNSAARAFGVILAIVVALLSAYATNTLRLQSEQIKNLKQDLVVAQDRIEEHRRAQNVMQEKAAYDKARLESILRRLIVLEEWRIEFSVECAQCRASLCKLSSAASTVNKDCGSCKGDE